MIADFVILRTANDHVHAFVLESMIVAYQSQNAEVVILHEEEARFQASTLRGVQLDRMRCARPESVFDARLELEALVNRLRRAVIFVSGFSQIFGNVRYANRLRDIGEQNNVTIVHLP